MRIIVKQYICMKIAKIISAAGMTTVLFAATAIPAFAATPNQQSCFGQDRAAWIAAHSGQEAGEILSARAGDNAQINADYRTGCQE